IPTRKWPADVVRKATSHPAEEVDQPGIEYLAAMYCRDVWKLSDAAHHLDRALAAIDTAPESKRPDYYLTAALFTARYCGDGSAARAFLEQAGEGGEVPYLRTRAETAVRLAEADPNKARHEAHVRFRWATRQEARQESPSACRM